MIFRKNAGFTLIEIMIVLGILITISGSMLLLVGKRLERAAIDFEDTQLAAIVEEIKGSFESEDFQQVNIAAFAGSIPSTTTPTAFSTSTTGSYSTTTEASWFAKVARHRGLSIAYGVAPSRATQPELARIAYNDFGNPRILIAAPAETDRQRFLLLSLVAPSDQLQLPSYDSGSAFFEAIFGTNWDTVINGVPSDWSSRLTASQVSAWNSSSSGSKLFKLRVRKIILQKHRLNLTNSNPTETLNVTTDGGQTVFTLPPSTTQVTAPVLEGRQVRVFLNSTANAVQQTFTLRRRSDVTYQ
jgi:type II secretory pathway pseudopilin PulG